MHRADGGNSTPPPATDDGASRQAEHHRRQQEVERIARRNPDLASLLAVSTVGLETFVASLKPGDVLSYYLPTRRAEPLRRVDFTPSGVVFRQLNITGNASCFFVIDISL